MERREENGWEYGRLHRRSALFTLFVALLIALLIFALVFQGTQIADEGMSPTLRAGDVVLFSRFSKFIRTPRRGDIYSADFEGASLLGRIVGLPGESIVIDEGNVYINGVFLSEAAYAQYAEANMEEIKLEEDEYFLLPDCRTYMTVSPENMRLEAGALRGRAFLRVAPFGKLGFFE